MADIEKLRKNLEDRGIRSSYFATAREAADYLDRQIDGTTVGIGGSMTARPALAPPRREGGAVTFISDYPAKMRIDDIAQKTRNEIVPVKFDEDGRLTTA